MSDNNWKTTGIIVIVGSGITLAGVVAGKIINKVKEGVTREKQMKALERKNNRTAMKENKVIYDEKAQ